MELRLVIRQASAVLKSRQFQMNFVSDNSLSWTTNTSDSQRTHTNHPETVIAVARKSAEDFLDVKPTSRGRKKAHDYRRNRLKPFIFNGGDSTYVVLRPHYPYSPLFETS